MENPVYPEAPDGTAAAKDCLMAVDYADIVYCGPGKGDTIEIISRKYLLYILSTANGIRAVLRFMEKPWKK